MFSTPTYWRAPPQPLFNKLRQPLNYQPCFFRILLERSLRDDISFTAEACPDGLGGVGRGDSAFYIACPQTICDASFIIILSWSCFSSMSSSPDIPTPLHPRHTCKVDNGQTTTSILNSARQYYLILHSTIKHDAYIPPHVYSNECFTKTGDTIIFTASVSSQ